MTSPADLRVSITVAPPTPQQAQAWTWLWQRILASDAPRPTLAAPAQPEARDA